MEFVLSQISRITALLLVAAAGISWWLVPGPQPLPKAQNQADAWALPTLPPQKPERFVAAIDGANLWGAVQAGAQTSLNDPEWRVAGVAVSGAEKLVVVSIENQPLQTLKSGDTLPGGARILAVSDDHLCLLINGKKRRLDLFE